MAEASVQSEPTGTMQVEYDDSLPLADPCILKDKRALLVKDLDVETVFESMKPYLYPSQVDAINTERNRGWKADVLIDHLDNLSLTNYHRFNTFLRIVAGVQPDLFSELVGRGPSEDEVDFCIKRYAKSLKNSIKEKGHSVDSPLDEEIQFDSQYVQLAIVQDRPEPEALSELPHRYQSYLSKVHEDDSNISAVEILDSVKDEPKPKRVSLHGRAGTGKTTTFQWLAREWSFNRWAPQFTLLFLLQLRMLSVFDHHITGIELLTLAGLYQVTEAGLMVPLLSWLRHAAGRVVVLIDGLDEVAGFAARLHNCPIIFDLKQRAHPIDLCLNLLKGNLLPGVKVVSASRPFAGLDALQFDKKLEILGLSESCVQEFVTRKHPSKTADIMAALTNSPLLMSICSITFYCTLISRLLADGVVFQQEDLATYTRLMAFLIVQCVERKLPEYCFLIQVSSYFHKLAHMGYRGVFSMQMKGQMTKLVFDEHDIVQARLTPQDLNSIQQAGLLHIEKLKIGMGSSVSAEFFHFSVQEMLASAYLLIRSELSENIFDRFFSGGQFSMALLYLFGLQHDTGSKWVKTIRSSVDPSSQGLNPNFEQQMNDFIESRTVQCSKWQYGGMSRLQLCQLLHEGQMEEKAKGVVDHVVPDGKLAIKDTQMTLVDLMAVSFVCKYAQAIVKIGIWNCGLTDTVIRFMCSSLLKHSVNNLVELDLSFNKIGSGGACAVAEWLQQNYTLQVLNLHDNNIGPDGATAVAAALQNNTTIHTLLVSYNNIGEKGAVAVAAMLENHTTINTLHVSVNNIGAPGAVAVAAALENNTTIHTLYVSHNNIGEMGAAAVAAMLHTNSTLHTLHADDNNIGDPGATSLAQVLESNSTVHTLNVGNNNISKKGASALAAAVQKNSTLHTLYVHSNRIGDEGAVALAAAMQVNSSLKELHLHKNNIGVIGQDAVRSVKRQGLTIYGLS